jgi:hypothetical protein
MKKLLGLSCPKEARREDAPVQNITSTNLSVDSVPRNTRLKILPRTSLPRIDLSVVVRVSGKWLVGPRSTSSTTASFLFDKAIQDATTEFTAQSQINRTRGARVIRR